MRKLLNILALTILSTNLYANCPTKYNIETSNLVGYVCIEDGIASFTGTYLKVDKESKLPILTDFHGEGGFNVNENVVDGGFALDNTATTENSEKVIIYKVYFDKTFNTGRLIGVMLGEPMQFSGTLTRE